jgi:hypothetical protein
MKESGRPVFVKWNGNARAIQREFKILRKLHARNKRNFPEPLFYKTSGQANFLGMEYIEPSAEGAAGDGAGENAPAAAAHLAAIAETLRDCGIIHRAVSPEHLLRTKDGGFCLVDYKLALDLEQQAFPEVEIFSLPLDQVRKMGAPYAPGALIWDDAHSLFAIAVRELALPAQALKGLRSSIGRMVCNVQGVLG